MPTEAPTAPPPAPAPTQQAPTPSSPTVAPARATPAQPQKIAAPTPQPPPAPAKREHPMVRAREKLRAAANKGPSEAAIQQAKLDGIDTSPVENQPKDQPETKVEAPTKGQEAAEQPKSDEVSTEETPTTGEDKEKLGPWQQKQKWEKQARQYEAENTQLKERLAKVGDVDEIRQRAEKAETRLKEVEDHLRFLDYQKSEEFQETYHKPYVKAWEGAMSELSELVVTNSDGESRPANQDDLIQLVNMPLGEARRLATELFGDSADDVMAHRRSIRELAQKQQSALADAQKTGAERIKQKEQATVSARQEAAQRFNEFKQQDDSQQDFLRAKEGDDEWNTLLNEKREWVEKAMFTSSTDPNATPEQRAQAARDHAHIRGRAIGFSMLKLENKRLAAKVESLNQQLQQLKSSEPGEGQPPGTTQQPVSSDPFERVRQQIRSRARPSTVPYQ